jgi:hypothetical protein
MKLAPSGALKSVRLKRHRCSITCYILLIAESTLLPNPSSSTLSAPRCSSPATDYENMFGRAFFKLD